MREMTVQIHIDKIFGEMKALAQNNGFEPPAKVIDKEAGAWMNVLFDAKSVAELETLWALVEKEFLGEERGLRKALVVVATGEQGWDDYILLHELDSKAASEPIRGEPKA